MLVSPACTYGLTNMYSSFLIVGFLKLSHDPLMGPGQHLKKEGETENVSIHIIICMQFYIYFIVCVCVCEYVYSFSGLWCKTFFFFPIPPPSNPHPTSDKHRYNLFPYAFGDFLTWPPTLLVPGVQHKSSYHLSKMFEKTPVGSVP